MLQVVRKPFISWRSGTQFVAMVTKIVSSYCRAPLVRYAAFLKYGTGHVFECLGWFCPATFIFRLSRHQHWHFVSLRPGTRDVATRVSGLKWVQSTELDIVNGSFCNLCALAVWLALHIFATQSWRVPNRTKQLSWSCSIGSCHAGVSKRFSCSISLAVYNI